MKRKIAALMASILLCTINVPIYAESTYILDEIDCENDSEEVVNIDDEDKENGEVSADEKIEISNNDLGDSFSEEESKDDLLCEDEIGQETSLELTTSDPIVSSMESYIKSLGGYFSSPYYKNGVEKCSQCCAFVNQVWHNVLGKDIYDLSSSDKYVSLAGETPKAFFDRVHAAPGDIIFTRYYHPDGGYWSVHNYILYDYNSTGAYIADGYQDSTTKKFLVWRNNGYIKYGNRYLENDGEYSDKPKPEKYRKADAELGKPGVWFRIYKIPNSVREKFGSSTSTPVTITKPSAPVVKNLSIESVDLEAGTYTVKASIDAPGGIDSVHFAVWTTANGQDDIAPNWTGSSSTLGTNLGNGVYSFKVRISDHGNQRGDYANAVYVVDKYGQTTLEGNKIVNLDRRAQIVSGGVYRSIIAGNYRQYFYLDSDNGISKVKYTVYPEKHTTYKRSGELEVYYNSSFGKNMACLTVDIKDYGNQRERYVNEITLIDKTGKSVTEKFYVDMNFAEESGTFGSIKWAISREDDGMVLDIDGTGDIPTIYQVDNGYYDAYPWSYYKNNIVKIHIGDNITKIPDGAFAHMSKLKEVNLPEGLKGIEKHAFADDVSLSGTIIVPCGVNLGAFANTKIDKVIYNHTYLRPDAVYLDQYISTAGRDDPVVECRTYRGDFSCCEIEEGYDSSGNILYRMGLCYAAPFPPGTTIYYHSSKWCDALDDAEKSRERWDKVVNAHNANPSYKLTFVDLDTYVVDLKLKETSLSLYPGETHILNFEVTPKELSDAITWKSSNDSVANVVSGKITAKNAGVATITAESTNGEKVSCVVNVVNKGNEEIRIPEHIIYLSEGDKYNLEATVMPVSASDKLVFESSNEYVLEIDNDGNMHAKNAGNATVCAYLSSNNENCVTCEVIVKDSNGNMPLPDEGECIEEQKENEGNKITPTPTPVPTKVPTPTPTPRPTETPSDIPNEDTEYTIEYTDTVDYNAASHIEKGGKTSASKIGDIEVKVYTPSGRLMSPYEYKVKFKNNKDTIAVKGKQPYFTITLKGKVDSVTKAAFKSVKYEFNITPCDLSTLTLAPTIKTTTNGTKIAKLVYMNVTGKKISLKQAKNGKGDYLVVAEDDETITIKGIGNYTGTAVLNK